MENSLGYAIVLKKKLRALPTHYCGIHLTSQLSKVVGRVLFSLCVPFLENTSASGKHQFAYTKNKGYRDALAFNMCSWIKAFNEKQQVGLYCSDVLGAFDRVYDERLQLKIDRIGLHPKFATLFGA